LSAHEIQDKKKEALKEYKQKNISKALNLFIELLANDPSNFEFLYYIGSAYFNQG
jgi:hypothetical protein